MVKNNDIDTAMTSLNKIMAQEGLTKRWRLTRTYEKPTWVSCHIMAHLAFILFMMMANGDKWMFADEEQSQLWEEQSNLRRGYEKQDQISDEEKQSGPLSWMLTI